MASFVVLTPPNGDEQDEKTIFIRDGFSLPALLFHILWLLWHRLWFAASLVLLILVALTSAAETFPQWSLLIVTSYVILTWFVALEGNAMRIASRQRYGWQMVAVVEAQDMATAEEIFYAGRAQTPLEGARQTAAGTRASRPGMKPPHLSSSASDPALGLLGFHERH